MEDIKAAHVVRMAVEDHIPNGDFTSREVAERALAWLEKHESEALAAWQRDVALGQLRELSSRYMNARQLTARAQMRGERVHNMVAAIKAGEDPLASVYVVDEQYTRRAVGDMTAEDLRFVANSYNLQARRATLEAAFFKELAKRVPDGQTVKEVLDSEKYAQLYRSITQEDSA